MMLVVAAHMAGIGGIADAAVGQCVLMYDVHRPSGRGGAMCRQHATVDEDYT